MRSMSRLKTWNRSRKHCQLQPTLSLMRLLFSWCRFIFHRSYSVAKKKKKTFSFLFELPINWALWFSVGDTPNVFFFIAGWIGSCKKMLQINKSPSKLVIYSFYCQRRCCSWKLNWVMNKRSPFHLLMSII